MKFLSIESSVKKQINYVKYLMDTVKNEALPNKKYSMHEISLLINDLKRSVKN
jgi:hypothetical protein